MKALLIVGKVIAPVPFQSVRWWYRREEREQKLSSKIILSVLWLPFGKLPIPDFWTPRKAYFYWSAAVSELVVGTWCM